MKDNFQPNQTCKCQKQLDPTNTYCEACLSKDQVIYEHKLSTIKQQLQHNNNILTNMQPLNIQPSELNLEEAIKEEQRLKMILEELQSNYKRIQLENDELSDQVYKYQDESDKQFLVEGIEHFALNEQLFTEEAKNIKLVEEKEKLKKSSLLAQFFKIQIDELNKIARLNGELLSHKTIHKILPMVEYILLYGPNKKYNKKVLLVIDLEEQIIVVSKRTTTGKVTEVEVSISSESPQKTIIWLEYLMEEIDAFIDFIEMRKQVTYKIEGKRIGGRTLQQDYQLCLFYLMNNLSFLLRWMQEYSS